MAILASGGAGEATGLASRTDSNTLFFVGAPGGGGNGYGGGLYDAGLLTVKQCTVAGESALGGLGGGACYYPLNANPICTTNVAGVVQGTGIYTESTFTLLNSIVAGNAPDSAGNILGGFPTSTPNLTSGDPLLQPLAYYGGPTPTMPPLTNSPAINAGSVAAAGPLGTDQRGLPRILENLVDLGAVEVGSNTLPPLRAADRLYRPSLPTASYCSPSTTFPASVTPFLPPPTSPCPLPNGPASVSPPKSPEAPAFSNSSIRRRRVSPNASTACSHLNETEPKVRRRSGSRTSVVIILKPIPGPKASDKRSQKVTNRNEQNEGPTAILARFRLADAGYSQASRLRFAAAGSSGRGELVLTSSFGSVAQRLEVVA